MNCFYNHVPVKVLFVGKSRKAGSWKMRGEQIASQRDCWSSDSSDIPKLLLNSDIVCFVKHVDDSVYRLAKKMKKICVYDVIDSWPQPDAYQYHGDRSAAVKFFTKKWKNYVWDGVIFPNSRMSQHLGHLVQDSIVIYHHFRVGINVNPIRKQVQCIGYEGNETYLGVWSTILKKICDENRWEWVVNPKCLADLDIAIAVREGEHNGFLANEYKSNVKLANIYGSGTPCVLGASEVSYHETDCGVVPFFSTEIQLRHSLSELRAYDKRIQLHNEFMYVREAYSLEHVCNLYELFFASLARKKKGSFLSV